VLGHFYFTKLLLPTLLSTAKSSPPGTVRIVNLTSCSAYFNGLDFDTCKDGPARRKKAPWELYCQSKYGNAVFSSELTRRYGDQGIISIPVHPGNIRTELQRSIPDGRRALLNSIFMYDPSYGALTPLWAGTCGDGKDFVGKIFDPVGTLRSASSQEPRQGTWKSAVEMVRGAGKRRVIDRIAMDPTCHHPMDILHPLM